MSNQQTRNTVTIEGAKLIWRNFKGAEDKFNRKGDRNFSVLLPTEVAKEMEVDGWNIKWLDPREEGDDPQAVIRVKVNYNGPRPPKIVMITSRGRTPLGPDEVEVVDYANIANADMILSPYNYEVNGKKGVACYLQTLFIEINEDELELKYAGTPDATESYPEEPPF